MKLVYIFFFYYYIIIVIKCYKIKDTNITMETLDFKKAFSYPFNRKIGLLNIFWMLLPIFGWLALGGYSVRIMKGFINNKFDELPEFSFKSDMSLGFFMFLKSIPFFLGYGVIISLLILISDVFRYLAMFIEFFIIPILFINFINKETISSLFEFEIIKVVFEDISDYIITMIKSIGLVLIYVVMCLILIGFPAMVFTPNIFIADFYKRKVLNN